MATTRKSLKQVITELEGRGSLNKQDADSLRTAPQWSLTSAEITGYLGGGIVAVGITWIIIAFAQDFNRTAVTLALYAVGALALATAKWLRPRSIRSGQAAEVLFGVGVGSLAGAIGITLNDLGLSGPIALATVSVLTIIIGLATCRRTSFVGTLIVVAAAQPLIGSIIEIFHLSKNAFPLIIVLSGALLVWLGLQRVGVALVARIAGSISIVIGSFIFAVVSENLIRPVASLAVCTALFYIGARRINLEFIVGGGIGVTFAIGIFTGRILDSIVVQGFIVTATGAAISALALVIVRRGESRIS
jgi:hypothetical protein